MESKKYFIVLEKEQKGPLSFSELESLNLKNETPIWFEGMKEWSVLEKIEELKSLKKVIPPVFNETNKSVTISSKSFFQKNRIAVFILLVFFALFLSYFGLNSFKKNEPIHNSNDFLKNIEISNEDVNEVEDNIKKELTPEELREELLNKEKQNPLKYLIVKTSISENRVQTQHATMFRHSKSIVDGYNMNCIIKNNATLATFKDVKLTIVYYSQTKAKIKSEDFIIYNFVQSKDSLVFPKKVYFPEGTKGYEVSVVGASN